MCNLKSTQFSIVKSNSSTKAIPDSGLEEMDPYLGAELMRMVIEEDPSTLEEREEAINTLLEENH